jgi:phosphatidylglycerophosphate synthase
MVESIKELEELTRKDHKEAWILSFYRKISIYFTRLFLYTPISANGVSVLSGVVGFLSVLFFISGSYYHSLAGGVLLFFWMVFDCCDGQVARHRKTMSAEGSYIDEVFGIVQSLAFVGISFGSYSRLGNLAFLLGFSTVVSIGFFHTLLWRKHYLTATKKTTSKGKAKGKELIRKVYGAIGCMYASAGNTFLILIGAMFGMLYLVLLFYGITYPIYMIAIITYRLYYGLERTEGV